MIKLEAKKYLNKIKLFTYDLLYPKMCVLCGKYGDMVCMGCFTKIEIVKTRTCLYCGKLSNSGKICQKCKIKNKSKISSALWVGHYNDKRLKDLIHAYKYDGIIELSETFAEMLTYAIKENIKYQDNIIVPVPLSRQKMARRGFNQSEIIARKISENLGVSGGLALSRIKNTRSQVGLSREERIANIKNAIICRDKDLINNRKIILIDDVATTGTTLNECAKVLIDNGAKKVDAVFVARG